MQNIRIYFSIILFSGILFTNSEQVDAKEYNKSGVSISTPAQWKLGDDSHFFGTRTLSFLIGEYSFVKIAVFPINETSARSYKKLNLSAYMNRNFIPRITNYSEDSYKIISKLISRPPFEGIQYRVSYFIPGHDDVEVEAYLLTLDMAKIIVIFHTKKKDLPIVVNEIQGVLKSIEYIGN